MIKLVDNSQRDLYFAFSNEVAMACDTMGINAHEVIKKVKLNILEHIYTWTCRWSML